MMNSLVLEVGVTMRLTIDAEMCTGHGRCYTLSPQLLSDDEEGFVTQRGQTIDVPTGLEGAARDAALELSRGRDLDR